MRTFPTFLGPVSPGWSANVRFGSSADIATCLACSQLSVLLNAPQADLFKLALKFFYSLPRVGAQSGHLVWVSLCEIDGKQQLFFDIVLHAEKLCVSAQYFCVFAKITPPHNFV
jgi:hypothetical protein